MTNFLTSSLYRYCLIAACMFSSDIPCMIPRAPTHDSDDERMTSMKVDNNTKRPRSKSSKRRSRSIVDSGATIHCIRDKSLFTHLDTSKCINVKVADKRVIRSEGVGTCAVQLRSASGTTHTVMLHNCVYSPKFSENLISTRRMWLDNKMSTHMGEVSYFKCARTHTRYYFQNDCKLDVVAEARRVTSDLDANLIHSRFNYCGKHRLRKLYDVTNGLGSVHDMSEYTPHPAVLEGASRKRAFSKRRSQVYSYFGERISSDLCGPFPTSVDGFTYALCFVDAHTDYSALYLLKSKSSAEVREAFDSFLKDHKEHLAHKKTVTWHTDNGGEFMSHDLDEFCNEFAVARSFSVPYAPPQNAQAERMWGILLRPLRTMLVAARIHDVFWSYAIRHANQCRNVMPSFSQPNMRTPWEALTGSKPDVSKFRIWGCLTWYMAPDHELDSKLSPRAWPAVHLGFDPHRNGYMVYIPHKNRITTGYHLTFQEHRFLKVTSTHVAGLPHIPKPLRKPQTLYKEPRDPAPAPPALPPLPPSSLAPQRDRGRDADDDRTDDDDHAEMSDDDDSRPTRVGTYGPPPPRATRNLNPNYANVIIDDVTNTSFAIKVDDALSDIPVPKTYDDAMTSALRDRWVASMEKEISTLITHDTWELVSIDEIPRDRKVVKSRFVYTVKYNRDGTVDRFKSRFVACGYSQIHGFDYNETFSATLRSTSFRLLCALAAGKKLTLDHFDVTSAFTQSDIDAVIYVEAPPGNFTPKDSQGRPKVLKLRKALYGTKQASKLWQDTLIRHLKTMGFHQLKNDPCIFMMRVRSHTLIVGVYVDDVVLAHDSPELLRWFTAKFTGVGGFNATHKGKLDWFLGMGVDHHGDGSITIDQSKYCEKMLGKFIPSHSTSSRSHTSPCNPDSFQRLTTSRNPAEREKLSKLPYLELVGSLLYLSTMTRPDIAYHMSVLCSFMHDPSLDCYNAAVDLLLYVGNTKHYHLRYGGSVAAPDGLKDPTSAKIIEDNCGFVAYSDASWHKPDHLGFNMFGYVVCLYGGPVAFAAKRLKVIAHSSAEAEYAAASYSCKEIAFVRNVCSELELGITGPVCLAVDNEAAIKIAENRGATGRTKHFSDAIHYIRHMLDHLVVCLRYVSTHEQLADGFTKPLDKGKFRTWCSRLMCGVGDEFV